MAGDLGSHIYNAWLAQLIHQGKAPGLYIVWQWKNILFDLLLFHLSNLVGFELAAKLAVSVCVLIFFWGLFAFLTAVSSQKPWFLTPLLAMLSYGYVFHMGFMNYYLSIGLASIALSFVWPLKGKGSIVALFLAPLILLAHPLGFLWFLGLAAYRFLWAKLPQKWKFLPLLGALLCLLLAHFFVLRHPDWQADWPDPPRLQWNGADQFFLFDDKYFYLSLVLLAFGTLITLVAIWQSGRNSLYWKERRILLELYAVCFLIAFLLPENLRPDPSAGWIGALVTRLTLISAIIGLSWLAAQPRKLWHLFGFTVAAAIFFTFLFRDTSFLNRIEASAQQITSALPPGTRLLASIFPPDDYRTLFLHIADRACAGRCILYSNYEPSTKQFRIRVHEGSPIVTSDPDANGEMESGVYEVQEEDLPLMQLYQCDEDDLTRLCIRPLSAGEKNGRLGYHPDVNPILPSSK